MAGQRVKTIKTSIRISGLRSLTKEYQDPKIIIQQPQHNVLSIAHQPSLAQATWVRQLLKQLDPAVSFAGVSGGFTLDCNGVEVELQVQPDFENVFLLSARVGCCEGLGYRSAKMAMRWALELNDVE